MFTLTAARLFLLLLNNVMRLNMEFFDTTPIGRIFHQNCVKVFNETFSLHKRSSSYEVFW